MVFGRKGVAQPAQDNSMQGHQAVLDHLRRQEAEKPLQRAQLAGRIVFDLVYRMLASERGVRIEDLIAVLASNGGYACILATLDALRGVGRTPRSVGMIEVAGKDGQRYYFGDMPNAALWEHGQSLLSLALGAAHACGGRVSREMVEAVMKQTAGAVGGPEFGVVHVAEPHAPGDAPIEYVRHLWPKVEEGLRLYEVPSEQWPMTLGFALQHAIEAGKAALDPTIAARICIECAVPMAKLDPARFPEHRR